RVMTVLRTAVALAKRPDGFTAAELYAQVRQRLQSQDYTKSQVSYDLRKLKAKTILEKITGRQRYRFTSEGLKTAVGLIVFRDEILEPVLALAHLDKKRGPKPKLDHRDHLYRNIQINLEALCVD
ncbi:hypothetical protein L6R21_27430, partial [bacterium]|nr:hypothetical protein [bacterium]